MSWSVCLWACRWPLSWRQLAATQIGMLQALAIFAAPARVEAVAAVAQTDKRTTLERLQTLRDGSLVQASDEHDGATRYVLLQPVREFVSERTDESTARVARQRLRLWLIDFAWQATPRDVATTTALALELPHVYAVISAPADGAGREAVELAVAWCRY